VVYDLDNLINKGCRRHRCRIPLWSIWSVSNIR